MTLGFPVPSMEVRSGAAKESHQGVYEVDSSSRGGGSESPSAAKQTPPPPLRLGDVDVCFFSGGAWKPE